VSDDEQGRPPADEQPTRSLEGSPTSPPGDTAPLYKRLGDFELLREIGRGGMGVVYEAGQISLKRRVALKVLPPGLGLTDQAVQRFEREAQAAAKLHHTNIVPVYATGQDQGCHYYAMELIEGQSLSQVLHDLRGEKPNPLMEATVTLAAPASSDAPAAESTTTAESTSYSDTDTGGRQWFDTVAKLLADVGDALNYAHEQGVIHRDVKPANLLLSGDGRLCLGDFGLARVAQEPGMTVSGSFLGTPAYMSPEQVAAGRVKLDHRTDVYSLGAVLYEMLTLQRPFLGDSREQVLTGILSKDPRPPRRVNPRVPMDLDTICLKAMEKDPDRRYATAGEMSADLKQFLQRGLIAARRAGPLRRTGKFLRRHPLAAVTVAALVVVAVLVGWVWTASSRQSHEAAMRAFADARYYQSQGEYESGLEQVESALERAPELAEARLLRARLLMELRRHDEAVVEARGMLEADPDDWTGHLILALADKTSESSLRVLESSVDEHMAEVERLAPETADGYHLRALAEEENAAAAIELLDRALAIDPAHSGALAERSRRHAKRKDFESALRDAERLVAVRPRSAQGHRMAGRIRVEQHDTERALERFGEALRIDPDDPITLNERARLYRGLGRHDEAMTDINRAIELDPDYPRSYYERAELNGALEQLENVLADLRQAVELNPDYEDAEVLLFDTLWAMGRKEELAKQMQQWEEAVAESEGTIDAETRSSLLIARAYVRLAEQQYQAAIADADRAVELDPDNWGRFLDRAIFRSQLGDTSGAEADRRRAAEFEVTAPAELLKRGNMLLLMPSSDSRQLARTDFTRAIEAAPWWSDPYVERGQILQTEKRFDDALADFDRAIELTPAWGEAYFYRGLLHRERERFERALADLDRAAELGLGSADPWATREVDLVASRVYVRLRLGRVEEALALHDAALLQRPDWVEMHIDKTLSLLRLGRGGEALDAANAGVAATEDSSHPLAVVLYPLRAGLRAAKLGECEEAGAELRNLDQIAETIPWGAILRAVIAIVHVDVLHEFCPRQYDGPLALERIKTAYALVPDDEQFQRCLGALLYRESEAAEALEVFQLLDEEHEFDEAGDLFYLAMTLWKLGRKAEARSVYDRAVARLEATFPNEVLPRRLQREAAALLGADR
jgi:serine/threonine protein kinase/Flp pilus assembly protein TadD